MVSSKERRRFSRFALQLAVRYQTRCPESGITHQGQGVIGNISLSGLFFYVDHTPDFRPGQFLSLTIIAPMLFLDNDHFPHLTATGAVVRLEPSGFANPNYGVALSFVEHLSFASPDLPNLSVVPQSAARSKETESDPLPVFLKPRISALVDPDQHALSEGGVGSWESSGKTYPGSKPSYGVRSSLL